MTEITQFVAYEGTTCPRCGYHLDAPDDNLDRRCLLCAVTVKAATVTFTFGPAGDDSPAP
jgi:tRNA(Ile2) C34 agmatinyltransferase TiaS